MTRAQERAATLVLGLLAIGCGAGQDPTRDAWDVVASAAVARKGTPAYAELDRWQGRGREVPASPVTLRAAIARLEQDYAARPGLQTAGRALVAWSVAGRPKACLEALALLARDQRNADLWSDEAACLLESSRADGSAWQAARALESSLEALALDVGHRAAVINRDLAVGLIGVSRPAGPADGPFGFLGQSSGADQRAAQSGVRLREQELSAARSLCAPGGNPTAFRTDIVREVLTRCVLRAWAEHVTGGNETDARRYVGQAAVLAEHLDRAEGGTCFAALIQDVTACGAQPHCTRKARGWLSVVAAGASWDEGKLAAAAAQRDSLEQAYPAPGSLGAAYAWLELTTLERHRRRADLAEQRAERVFDASRPTCAHPRGRAAWALSLLRFERSDFAGAEAASTQALDLLARSPDTEAFAVASNVAAGIARELERFEVAWQHCRRSLTALWQARLLRRQSILSGAATLARRSGLPRVAHLIREQAVRDAMQASAWTALVFRLAESAEDASNAGEAELGRRRMLDAIASMDRVDPETRRLAVAFHALAFSKVFGASRYEQALRLIDEAVALQQQRRMTFQIPQLLGRRAVLAASTGDDAAVTRYLRQALQKDGVAERAMPSALPPGGWNTLSEIASEYLRRDGQDKAVRLLQQPAVREIDMAAAHAPDVTVIRYVRTADGIFAFGRADRTTFWFRSDRRSGDVEADIASVRRHLASEQSTAVTRECLTRLFDDLVRPAWGHVRHGSRLVVIADGTLGQLPFSALVDRSTDRYLVEDVVVQHYAAQSLSHAEGRMQAAVIAGPGAASSAGMPSLPHAAAEMSAVASLYAAPTVLPGASRERLLSALREANVFHFAGHAVVNGTRPELSRLVVGGTDAADDSVLAQDIASSRLGQLQLVVLSACSTGVNSGAGGGQNGLAAAFLRAGAAAVVVTLWEVADNDARDVAMPLHVHWLNGATSSAALRQAQLSLIRTDRQRPWRWAAFVSVHTRSPEALNADRHRGVRSNQG